MKWRSKLRVMGRGNGAISFDEVERFGIDWQLDAEPVSPVFRIVGKTPDGIDGEGWKDSFEMAMGLRGDAQARERLTLHAQIGQTIVLQVRARSREQALAYGRNVIEDTLRLDWLERVASYEEA